jgi:hypothetical protein
MIEDVAPFAVIARAFPLLAQELRAEWGTPHFNVFLDSLELETTSKHRVGFTQEVLLALFALGAEHDRRFPELVAPPSGKWVS